MGYLRQYSPFMQMITILGFLCGFLLLYTFLVPMIFPSISGGYQFDQISDPVAQKDPGFVQALKIAQMLWTLIVFLVPALLFSYFAHPRPAEYLGLRRAPKADQLILAIVLLLAVIPFVGVTADWNASWNVSQAMRDMEEMAKQQTKMMLDMPDIPSLLVSLLLVSLLPAIAEEVLFRGVIQRILSEKMNPWIAAGIAAIIFSLIHMQFLGFVPRVVLGFVMGAIFLTTGNLWLAIVAHFINNGLQIVLVYLFQHKMITYDVIEEAPTPIYYGIASLLVAGFLLVVLHRRAKAAGQTFALPQEPAADDDEDSVIKDY